MRTVARYRVEAKLETDAAAARLELIRERVDAWLGDKGNTECSEKGLFLVLRDGRRASFEMESYEGSGSAYAWQIDEPVPQGRFQTRLTLASRGDSVEFVANLRAGNDTGSLARFNADVHRPRIVSEILRRWSDWRVGLTEVRSTATPLFGRVTGATFGDVLTNPARTLPFIVVSEHDSFALHPRLRDWLAEDLLGLGLVYQLDTEASWGLTESLGVERSCHSGAVRIYWPGFGEDGDDPRAHPLWTKDRMLGGAVDAVDAAERVRQTIRWKALAMSAFAAGGRTLFEDVRDQKVRDEAAKRRAQVATTAQEKAYYESEVLRLEEEERVLSAQVEELKRQVEDLTKANFELIDENDLLSGQVRSLTEALRYRVEGAAAPVSENVKAVEGPVAPGCIKEAVDAARGRFGAELVFGSDVDTGVADLDPDAAPPAKVFRYLELLAELVREKRSKSSLGTSDLLWLSDRGVVGSSESDTILNDANQMKRRRWNDGRGKRQFHFHLKPKKVGSPDFCARIYFDWDEESKRMIIGWVGRHP